MGPSRVCVRCSQPADSSQRSYCKTCWNLKQKTWRRANPERTIEIQRGQRERRKHDVIVAYGGKCVCCGEAAEAFLTVDHINGGGRAHLRSIKRTPGLHFYIWLKKQGFPKDQFRLLCMNCNFALGHYGVCPHNFGQRVYLNYSKKAK